MNRLDQTITGEGQRNIVYANLLHHFLYETNRNTDNKNNPNNGKLYRRTLKDSGDSNLKNLTAEYIGRIVGPAGANPFMSFGSLASVNEKGKKENIDLSPSMQISYPYDQQGHISSDKTGDDITPVAQIASLSNGMLVSGEHNDNIRYT